MSVASPTLASDPLPPNVVLIEEAYQNGGISYETQNDYHETTIRVNPVCETATPTLTNTPTPTSTPTSTPTATPTPTYAPTGTITPNTPTMTPFTFHVFTFHANCFFIGSSSFVNLWDHRLYGIIAPKSRRLDRRMRDGQL
jgi:hypothetical protein